MATRSSTEARLAHGNVEQHGSPGWRTAASSARQPLDGARQRICREDCARRTADRSLPFASLPCPVCRAEPDGNDVAEQNMLFTVRSARTAVILSPVVF